MPGACPGDGAPATVDVVDGTGDPAVADDVATRLRAAGLTVGTVSTATVTASGVEHPGSEEAGARWLAEALAATELLRAADVPHVTVVLGPTDSAALVQSVDALAACG